MSHNAAEMDIQIETERIERERKWEQYSIPRMTQIVPGLVLGNVQSSWNIKMLMDNRIKAIVSLSDGPWALWRSHTRRAVPEDHHKWVQAADSPTQDLLKYMRDICDFIDQLASPELSSLASLPVDAQHITDDKPEAIMIHCDLGISRSPTVVIAYLMCKLHIPQTEALEFVRMKQTPIRVRPSTNFARQLQVWDEVGYQVWADEEKTVPKAPYKAYLEHRAVLLEKSGLTGNEPLAPLSL
ncbi:dual specificity phosphatase Yvh1 [Penicillium coprophilum]|uniref:dual specificity phosphatase Yvh1 n=1 Tax=Penicillium coprophilum TaxID=36646 RepID=UPI00239A9B3C|nr:dual specificity phosphatase Yvh1 [Penicillium coprophilum]KAJ5173551.1 dual specificity phosphatase Yvh1 [Penicillium coprophilum]